MNQNRRRALLAAASATALGFLPTTAPAHAADKYPHKPITLVVAYPAGGDTDVLARLIGEKLTARLGQPVIVENRTGAAGTIGTAYVSKAAPDGYTLLLAPNTIAITPHVLKGVAGAQVNPVNDLTSISQLGRQSLFVVATATTGVSSIKDLVASVKAGKITSYASPGNGSPMHILGELFDKATGVKITQVPYRGSVPAVADLVGGQIPMMYTTLGPVAQYIKAGKLVPLAVADAKRSPFLPQVSTLAEQGYPGVEVGAWQALMGPKGMSPELVKLLNQHCEAILKMPDVAARMETIAITPTGGDPAAMSKLVQSDFQRYREIVKEFGIQAN
ncbi:exported protein [Comamonas testosteroni]|uniref:Exported protein n=1 Tax=Comamonas testosteroni TaxID=285 RepID=A0A5A7MM98_COMTE|nr:tripartite tricarboxylate transporter substrate binding protein [Comamonas testosteroni]GEQ77835.1 exported protein [Comamonas testosteroni]